MEKVTAAEAKQKFGQIIDKAQRAPVQITKHGRGVAFLVSQEQYELDQQQRDIWLSETIRQSREEFEKGLGIPAEEVYAKLRKRLFNLDAQSNTEKSVS